jgi:Amidohydrolase
MWDVDLMVREMKRVSAKGVHAVTFSMNPFRLDLDSLHSGYWDPFWQVCQDLEIVICMHIGSGGFMIQTSPDAPMLTRVTCSGINIYPTAADLLWSPMMHKFPRLRFALAEGGIGWIPYFLERADYTYKHHVAHWPDHPFYGQKPSERFNERFITCFIDDAHGVASLDLMNENNVTWECDYPHPDSTWPNSPEDAWRYLQLAGSDQRINKITHENAMRHFQFDPFSVRPRHDCTVAALRTHADNVDTTFIPGQQNNLALMTQLVVEARAHAPVPA